MLLLETGHEPAHRIDNRYVDQHQRGVDPNIAPALDRRIGPRPRAWLDGDLGLRALCPTGHRQSAKQKTAVARRHSVPPSVYQRKMRQPGMVHLIRDGRGAAGSSAPPL